MSTLCWSCQRQPAVTGDGRCQSCSAAPPPHAAPTMAAPTSGPPSPPPPPPPQGGPGYGYPQAPPPGQMPGQTPQYPGAPGGAYPQYPAGAGGAPAAPTGAQWSDPKGISTAVVVLLVIAAVAYLFMMGAAGNMYGVLDDIENNPATVTLQEAQDADDMYNAAIVLRGLSLLAAGIVFIVWFHRVRVNAEIFNPGGQRMGRGWSIGGWFVPIVNLWFPNQIARDSWRSSLPYGANPGMGLLNAWWSLWVIGFVISLIGFNWDSDGVEGVSSQEEFDSFQREVSTTALSSLVLIAAAIVAILVVRRLTAFQLTKWAQGPSPTPQMGPGGMGPGGPGPYGPGPY